MNADSLAEVRAAIQTGDVNRARDLLRPYLIDQPTADAYYLAYRVAVNDYQRRKFLNQALELDPFHEDAERALSALDQGLRIPEGDVQKPKRTVSTSAPAYFESKSKHDFDDLGQTPQRYELAGFGQRFAAYFLDGVIMALVSAMVTLLFIGSLDEVPLFTMSTGDFSSLQQENNLLNLLFITFNIAYHVYFLTQRDGQTPGKMALGIKVIKRNGEPISIVDAFLRNIVGYQLSTIFILIGFFWMLFDPQNQTWHDKIVNTVVVKKPSP